MAIVIVRDVLWLTVGIAMTTLLRQRLMEDLQLRGLSGRTQEMYALAMEQLA